MNDKHCFKALDCTLCDIHKCPDWPYGGVTVIHGGDFQQILPVIIKGSKEDIMNASLQQSYLWPKMNIITLHCNVHLDRSEEENAFAEWLLDVSHGCYNAEDGTIALPEHMVTTDLSMFIYKMYGDMFDMPHCPSPTYFLQWAILAPKNIHVQTTNDEILRCMPGNEVTLFSADRMLNKKGSTDTWEANIPLEYLQSLELAALPPSRLKIEEGCPLILLQNLQATQGLCNGTHLILLHAQSHVLEIQILGGDYNGKIALIPWIALIPSAEEGYTFQFKWHQFPVHLAFAMTINKAEGQSLHMVGVDLHVPVFSHGQLYVALSQVTSSHQVYILLPQDSKGRTTNVVYPKVLLDWKNKYLCLLQNSIARFLENYPRHICEGECICHELRHADTQNQ